MDILDYNELEEQLVKIVDKLRKYKDSTIEIDKTEYQRYNFCSDIEETISIGIGYHNGVNNKFEIIIKRKKSADYSYDYKVTYQQWKPFATMGKVLDRVTFEVPSAIDILDIIPKNEKKLFNIISEYRYKTEFERREIEEIKYML
jgi:hypothetical protein